eukprot:scaffold89379_cov62-Cyclotella_meneghiniana.AAC.2
MDDDGALTSFDNYSTVKSESCIMHQAVCYCSARWQYDIQESWRSFDRSALKKFQDASNYKKSAKVLKAFREGLRKARRFERRSGRLKDERHSQCSQTMRTVRPSS